VKTEFAGRVKVIPGTFDEYFVAVAMQEGSTLQEPVNQALLQLMETEEWRGLLKRYLK
jgi:ABC-type amino acid transport substrate-binding protein